MRSLFVIAGLLAAALLLPAPNAQAQSDLLNQGLDLLGGSKEGPVARSRSKAVRLTTVTK